MCERGYCESKLYKNGPRFTKTTPTASPKHYQSTKSTRPLVNHRPTCRQLSQFIKMWSNKSTTTLILKTEQHKNSTVLK